VYLSCSGEGHKVFADSLHQWIVETRNFKIDKPRSLSIDVQTLLPHRGDMLLIDNLSRIARDKTSLAATMSVDMDDPVFHGHFPGDPVYPGVLLIEAIAQTGICLVKLVSWDEVSDVRSDGIRVRAIKVLYAEFAGEVKPGDVLDIEVRIYHVTPFLSVFGGRILRDNALQAIAIVEVYVGE
jgi:3-hydroxyacyl-[acyl-carrier-protein] dehydratase